VRHSGALPGDLVAVQGIGGLGHLGIQFAQKFGYEVARSARIRKQRAREETGGERVIDSQATKRSRGIAKTRRRQDNSGYGSKLKSNV